jgi:hypothetical protein
VTLDLPNGKSIKGEYDMELDGKIDDVKSASPWSYKNKFENFETLKMGDSFGYIAQLVGYAEGAGKDVGGWWVVNKANGEFKYVPADGVDKEAELAKIEALVDYIENDEPFERCFEPEPETYYKKQSGNLVLPQECKFCNFKHKCHKNLQTLNPTPVPHKRIYMASSKLLGSSTGKYEQLYPAVLSRSKAGPAVIIALIDGMMSRLRMASRIWLM